MSKRRKVRPGSPDVVVAYLRVSTAEQSLGPEAQRAAIESWCKAKEAALAAVHIDHGVSGAAAIDKRAGLLDAINALTAHRAGVLLVQKRDRLAREITQAAAIEGLVEGCGAVVATTEGDAGDDPNNWLLRTFKDALAHYERLQIQTRTKAALAVKRSRGERIGYVPIGNGVVGSMLTENESELHAIARARALRADGVSYNRIAETLNVEGYKARGKRWYGKSVWHMCRRAA